MRVPKRARSSSPRMVHCRRGLRLVQNGPGGRLQVLRGTDSGPPNPLRSSSSLRTPTLRSRVSRSSAKQDRAALTFLQLPGDGVGAAAPLRVPVQLIISGRAAPDLHRSEPTGAAPSRACYAQPSRSLPPLFIGSPGLPAPARARPTGAGTGGWGRDRAGAEAVGLRVGGGEGCPLAAAPRLPGAPWRRGPHQSILEECSRHPRTRLIAGATWGPLRTFCPRGMVQLGSVSHPPSSSGCGHREGSGHRGLHGWG